MQSFFSTLVPSYRETIGGDYKSPAQERAENDAAAAEQEIADADEFCRSRLEMVLGEIHQMGRGLPSSGYRGLEPINRYQDLIDGLLSAVHDGLSADAAKRTQEAFEARGRR